MLSKILGCSDRLQKNFPVISQLCGPETPQLAAEEQPKKPVVFLHVAFGFPTQGKHYYAKKIDDVKINKKIGENSAPRPPPPMHSHTNRVGFWRVGALPATLCRGDPQAGLPTGFRKVLAEEPQGRSCLGARSASKPFPGLTDSPLCNRQSRCLMNHGSDLCFQMQGCFS